MNHQYLLLIIITIKFYLDAVINELAACIYMPKLLITYTHIITQFYHLTKNIILQVSSSQHKTYVHI